MKVLAIETSALVASVAVLEDDQLICEYTTNYKKTHSQTIMPMIQEISQTIELDLASLDIIGVSSGPGSFTGLRIGSATAKGLAQVLGIKIAAVPTLEALAYNIGDTDKLICPMMDARRQQVYTALYKYDNHRLVTLLEPDARSIQSIVTEIKKFNMEVLLLGDGVGPNKEEINALLSQENYQMAKANNNLQRAASVGALAIEYAKAGRLQTCEEHHPIYLRKSQAEREYEERQS
jgi:tRNA threonylcarbamoyladenosine biosynthesis protein TsaB